MRPRFISIPTFRHFFEWLKSRLDEKANAVHEHAEYLSELPLPLTKIGETDGQMTYDGQVVTGGGGGEPAWGEYGQFKKVMIPEHIIGGQGYGDTDAFWDFVRDEYAYKPGMYVFVYKHDRTGYMEPSDFYSADGIMVTHAFDPDSQEWLDLDEIGIGSFPINEIPEDLAETISEFGGFVWDNFEMAGDPIHVWEAPEPPEPSELQEVVFEAGTIMWFENPDSQGTVVFHTLTRDYVHDSGTEYVYQLTTVGNEYEEGRWRRHVGNTTRYYGTPKPGAPVDPER